MALTIFFQQIESLPGWTEALRLRTKACSRALSLNTLFSKSY